MPASERRPDKQFQLLIKPVAADCNMVCGYCFYRAKNELFGPGPHRMSHEMLERLTADFMSYGFEPTVFVWQGGEPVMAGLEFYEKAVSLQQSYGKPGQRVGNALQTNGVMLDRAWADFLGEYNFLVGLSLDGPRDVHDACRKTASGEGTFDRVTKAARMLRAQNVALNILSVVSRANVTKAKEVYRFFRREGFTELQFIPCLERDPASGGIADFCPSPEDYGRFLCELFDEWMADGAGEVSLRTFDSFVSGAAGMGATVCTFAPRCGAYLLIEHNGDVYPCDFFVTPGWKVGNITETRLREFFDKEKEKQFKRMKSAPDKGCFDCKWWKYCHAGCVKDWVSARGKAARKSYFCGSYRMFFEHAHDEVARLARRVVGKRPGRNDPCPCGSGKKYKKCCMKETQALD